MSLKAASIELWESVLEAKRSGSGYKCKCPVHSDGSPSFVFSEDEKTAFGVKFKCLAGCDSVIIIEELQNMGLLQSDGKSDNNKIHLPVPPEFDGMKYVTHYTYKSEYGEDLLHVGRYESNGKKQTIPFAGKPEEDWKWWKSGLKQYKEKRPLYNLERVAQSNDVFVVEGEKCVDALRRIGIIGTCSLGGSGAACLADWTPLIGKNVYIWRDRDAPGAKYEFAVKKCLTALDIKFKVVDASKLNNI